ncbi:hypothetical protein RU080_19235 [Shewanella algae]|uniref:hypothetical protein n=1 Tax=Shewanella algae TaxID=38313 RepID=UPI0029363F1F|nr:hypothetical protein [Shewanella algae]MDV2963869.1 hypothetical protein [Shewanella algae]
MSISDHKYVNFSEDYELNYHLEKVDKRQTEDNRNMLRTMGDELKAALNKILLLHVEFHPYVSQQKHRLD